MTAAPTTSTPDQGDPDDAVRDRASGAVARGADRRLREPGAAEGRRAEGRRSPGVVGVDGDVDDGALPRRPASGGPGVGEAACVTGAAGDRVPARAARPLVPDAAARLRRAAVVSVADEGSVSGRLLDRLGRARIGGAAVRRARGPVHADAARGLDRRTLHLAARRRRARRGQHLGGARGSADATARQRALDRRPEPTVARPGHPRDPRRRARGTVPHERLGRDRAQVRPAAARGVRTRGRRACSVAGSTRCRTSSTSRSSARPRRSCAQTVARRRRRRRARRAGATARRATQGRVGAARPRPRRPRPRRRARRVPASARDARPADGDLRVHDQGVRPRDRRTPAEPLRAPRRGADRPAPRGGRPHARRPSGTASPQGRPRQSSSPGPAGASTGVSFLLHPGSRYPRRSRLATRPQPRRRPRSAASCSTSPASTESSERLVTVAPDVSVVDEPRRLHQQDRRLGAGRGARLRRDGGLAAQVARRPTTGSTSRWGSRR